MTLFASRNGVLRRTFGESASVGQHSPDYAGQLAGDDYQGVAVVFATAAMPSVDALEVGMFAIDDKGGQIERVAEGRRTAFADLAASADGVARLAEARVEAGIGDVLVGGAEVLDGIAFGVNDGCEGGRDAQREERRLDLLHAPVEFLFDGSHLLSQHSQVVEDGGELGFGDV